MLPHTLQRRDFLAVGAAVIDFGKIPTRKAGKAFFRLLRPPRLGAVQLRLPLDSEPARGGGRE